MTDTTQKERPTMFRSMLRKPVAVGALAGALTAVTVFGGTGAFLAMAQDSPDTTTPETTAPETTPDTEGPTAEERQAQIDEWRQCMADNGVELPEPQVDENGRRVRPERPLLDDAEREALDSAMEACGPPPFGRHHRGGRGPVALTDEQRQCMADAGFELPEPQVDENGRRVRPERPALDAEQREAFRAAAEACGLPIGGPGCDGEGKASGSTDESTPESSEPNVEGSSYSV
jgi:hypothetical protein